MTWSLTVQKQLSDSFSEAALDRELVIEVNDFNALASTSLTKNPSSIFYRVRLLVHVIRNMDLYPVIIVVTVSTSYFYCSNLQPFIN